MFELYPDSAKSHMHAIFSACMAGDRDEAERYIAAARSRWPGDQSLIQAESYVAMEKRQWTRALPLLETLLTMSPNDENYLRSLDNVQRNIAEHATSE
jgi:uncharacterized protein HemY